MQETKKSKSNVMQAVMCVLLCCSVILSCVTLIGARKSAKQLETISTAVGAQIDTGKEDDVIIADEYVIRSTRQISDAYLNGTEDTLSDRDKETLSMAKDVLSKIIKEGMSDYEKEEACYLWLCKEMKSDDSILTVIHESAADSDNPFGVLKHHNAVCVGYATTMRLFMQMLGIECMVIHASDLIHSWDLIKLDDEWYHVDCYSDTETLYGNFNMNDDAAAVNHTWNHEFFPAATGTKYSYAAQNAVQIKNIYAIPQWVKQLLDKGETLAVCSFKEKVTPKTEKEAAAIIEILTEGLGSVDKYNDDCSIEFEWSKDDAGDYLLTYRFYDYKEDQLDISDKLRSKIENKITSVFGDLIEFYHEDGDYGNADMTETTTAVPKG